METGKKLATFAWHDSWHGELFVTEAHVPRPRRPRWKFTKQPQVAQQSSSLRGWRFFWCVFLFVVRKVRDTTARKPNRGRKRKRWRGEKVVSSPRPLPHCFLFRPQFGIRAALTLTLRNTHKKNTEKTASYAGEQRFGNLIYLEHLSGNF